MKTFVDASVLIAAARGNVEVSQPALELFDDPDREFVGSVYLQLEVVPKAHFQGYLVEVEFYDAFFAGCRDWVESGVALSTSALDEAKACGLSAIDALHVAAAASAGAEELVTLESQTKPLHRTSRVVVRQLRSGES